MYIYVFAFVLDFIVVVIVVFIQCYFYFYFVCQLNFGNPCFVAQVSGKILVDELLWVWFDSRKGEKTQSHFNIKNKNRFFCSALTSINISSFTFNLNLTTIFFENGVTSFFNILSTFVFSSYAVSHCQSLCGPWNLLSLHLLRYKSNCIYQFLFIQRCFGCYFFVCRIALLCNAFNLFAFFFFLYFILSNCRNTHFPMKPRNSRGCCVFIISMYDYLCHISCVAKFHAWGIYCP